MTFKDGLMPYLTYILLCDEYNLAWGSTLVDDMLYEQDRMSDRHKKRMIKWAYKKKLFTSNKIENGIRLTEKGEKYVRARMTEKDVAQAKCLIEFALRKQKE